MVACLSHNYRHPRQAGLHCRAPAAFARYQLKSLTLWSNDQWLNDSLITDRHCQLLKFGFIERAAGLKWAWTYFLNVYVRLGIIVWRALHQLGWCDWD